MARTKTCSVKAQSHGEKMKENVKFSLMLVAYSFIVFD